MNRSKRRYGAILTVVIVLAAFVAFNLICVGTGAYADLDKGAVSLSANRFLRVDGLEGLDELRQKYFNTASFVDLAKVSYEGDRWVIVELEGETLYDAFKKSAYSDFSAYCKTDAADKLRNKLEADHAEFLDLLDENAVDYTYKYSYTTLNNGVALKVSSGAYNVIKQTNGVKDLYFSETYAEPKVAVSNNAQVYTTGIYDSAALKDFNGNSYQGEGMVVAILDTGLDASHEAFQNMPSVPAWSKEDVALKMSQSNNFSAKATVDEVYYNAKVPFAYDYADDDPNVYPSYSSHGTHVAGIVAGQSEYVVNEETGETFLGVAPEAQLVICKVFTDNLDSKSLGGANSIDILAAISDCVELGVDVINMSLGTSCGFSDERSDNKTTEIYNRVKEAGISLIVAASNDYSSGFGGGNGTNLASNPDSATVGSPSTYPAALSVASINGQQATYIQANNDENQFAFITTSSDENGNEYKFVELLYDIAKKPLTETLNFKYIVIGGVGRATNYNTVVRREIADKEGYDGVIALVKRGDTTFAEKVQTAMDYDVDACIIYNNVSGVIRMSLGEVDNPVPTCSISMDAGKVLVDNAVRNVGSIQVSMDFKAGPFMSDFSSWGPLPNLELKPEITAHGGEITSAVPGGYDIYSGTSMASPNMAGAVAVLRQYLKEAFAEELASDPVALNARVNQVVMSTATIALNEEGNPYSPRKQGAGLARIFDAVKAESYITVLDENGNAKDKTKAELFDDKKRTGVYTVEFVINNTSGKTEWYNPYTYVMTETLASDNKTVAEKAHMLTDSTVVYYVNGVEHTGDIEVSPNAKLSVKAVITLGAAGRNYIEKSFKNGMYVEGFVSLKGTKGTEIAIGLPYLAFYGDWNDAPLFDYDTYEIAESQKDTSVAEEDKLKASSAATRPLGIYWDDQYILELGAYLYAMDESEVAIYPSKEKAAVSMYDEVGRRTVYEFYMVYAGLLRNAAYMNVEVTDSVTGELLYRERQENIGKSYAAGGSNVGARITLELNPSEWGLSNNSTYNVHLQGELDYPSNGKTNEKDSFDCQFTVDYEAPRMMDYRVRYDSYKDENKQTKYRIFLDVDVYDNQYVMEVMPCYLRPDKDGEGNVLTLATQYPIPVYASGKGELNTVSFEITDIYDDFVKAGELYLAIEDYAMNQSVYKVILDSAIEYPTGVILSTDGKLTDTGNTGRNPNGIQYGIYDLVLAPHEAYKPTVSIAQSDILPRTLSLSIQSGDVVAVNEEEIFAKSSGVSTVVFCGDGQEDEVVYAKINIIVTGDEKQLPRLNKISFLPTVGGSYNAVALEGTLPTLEINTNQSVELRIKTEPWYLGDFVEYEWSTSNGAIATVDDGKVQALQKGSTVVTASVVGNATVSKSVNIVVSDEFRITSYTLYDYFGGEDCVIPDRKNVMYLDDECFQYNTTLRRIVLPSTLTEIPEYAFKGCSNLEEVVIPGQCTTIKKGAFEGCAKLTKVSFGYFVDKNKKEDTNFYGVINVGEAAFKNCTALTTLESVSLSDPSIREELTKRITTVGNSAFEGCTSLKAVDLTELRVTDSRAFAKCTALETVIIGRDTKFGAEMFYGCSKLKSLEGEYTANSVPAGLFAQCTSFDTFAFANANAEKYTVGKYAFSETALDGITFPDGEVTIGSGAFFGCNSLKYVELSDNTVLKANELSPFGNCTLFGEYRVSASNANYSAEAGVLYNKDKTEICAVPTAVSELTLPVSVKTIGRAAFAGTKFLDSFDASNIENVGTYAFAGSSVKTVAFSSELKILPDGIFSGCTKLTAVTGLDSVVEVGNSAFNGCTALQEINLPKVEKIGNNAFDGSVLATVSAENLTELGYRAFYKTKLKEVNFPSLAKIGAEAFANNNTLTTVTLGPVTEMGGSVFVNTMRLNKVVFGEGTKVVGDRAFYTEFNDGTNKKLLTSVILPDGVETIGFEAFRSCVNLKTVNLTGTEYIADGAFYGCTRLESANLTSVLSVGNSAFEGSGLKEAVLTVATVVGENAFKGSQLATLSIPNIERIGAYAFAGTLLTEVTIPATMNERSYVYNWDKLDDKNRVEKVYSRIELNYGKGAFSDIATLTKINVATGNEVYFSVDGVLYSYVENGYVLEQYPSAKQGGSYTVIDGTIAIGAAAFEGVTVLTEVTFPYSVKTIGSKAFFGSSVKHFVFNSVEAPDLLAESVDGDSYYSDDWNNWSEEDQMVYIIFGSDPENCVNSDVYYANFCNYVAMRIFLLEEYQPKFELSMTIPKNGKGYDTEIWTKFFDEIIVTDEILPDNTTHAALDAINAIENVMSLAEIANAVDMDALTEISEVVSGARATYNKITSSEQLNLTETKEALAILLANEKALRDRKATLGHPVKVNGLELSAIPTKIRYNDGETFDPTGMEVKIVFEDGSELPITEYVLDKTVLTYGDDFVTVSYTYEGQTYTANVYVNINAPATKEPNKDPNEGGEEPVDVDKEGLSVGAIVGISVGSVAFVAIAVVVVLLLLRKKGILGGKKKEEAVEEIVATENETTEE